MVINWGTDYCNQFFVIFESNKANNILNDELILTVFQNLKLFHRQNNSIENSKIQVLLELSRTKSTKVSIIG